MTAEPVAGPREMIARAEALRPALIERQEETERLARYPEATHYVRDLGTYWSHNTPSQYELLSQTLAMLHLGFPKHELPATGA